MDVHVTQPMGNPARHRAGWQEGEIIMPRLSCWCSAALIAMLLASSAPGEVFVLTNDGRVEGELLNPRESPREKYVIRTPTGGTVTLARQQVSKVLTRSPDQEEYERIRPQYADTAEAQWELAAWCLENGMPAERKIHLQRVIDLEPDHKEARRILGYSLFQGEWKTQAERMTQRGFVWHKGRWRLPQEVQLIQQRRERELAEKGWYRDIKRWLGWLDTARAPLAIENFQELDDPNAVPALAHFLKNTSHEQVKILLVDTLAQIGSPAAVDVLGHAALADDYNEVRLTCLDYLKQQPRPGIVKLFVQSLRSKDNPTINRAAVGLKEMNDPSAIRPLIDALNTTHRAKITQGSPGGIGAAFGNQGGGGLSVGSKTKIIESHLRNPAVLEALVTLTGGTNFSYDETAWKHWFSTQQPAAQLDARRD